MHNLSALAAFDEQKLPNIKQLGENIIHTFQQAMMKEWNAAEQVVLPEDLAQRLLVGVCV